MAKYRANSQDTFKTLKIKALDSMPVGTIVDYDGETSDIPTGWEEVGNDYSTTEINTGKTWIDGKPIYRIVLNQSSYTQNTNFNISISSLKVDTLINLNGMTYSSTQHIPIPFANQNNEVNYAYRNGDNIVCRLGYGTSANIVLEYTKTTD